jgi:hypothetical protein
MVYHLLALRHIAGWDKDALARPCGQPLVHFDGAVLPIYSCVMSDFAERVRACTASLSDDHSALVKLKPMV